jgi:hypothetical protein
VWEHGEGEPVAEQQPPRASGCEGITSSQGRRLGVVEASLPEKHQAPYLARQMSKWFYDISTGAARLLEQTVVVLLLERALVSWLLAMDEYGGHEDLCGSGRRRVIPYIYRRTVVVLPKPALPESAYLSAPLKWRLSKPFIAHGRIVTLRPGARQVAPRWLKTYTTSKVIMVRRSK